MWAPECKCPIPTLATCMRFYLPIPQFTSPHPPWSTSPPPHRHTYLPTLEIPPLQLQPFCSNRPSCQEKARRCKSADTCISVYISKYCNCTTDPGRCTVHRVAAVQILLPVPARLLTSGKPASRQYLRLLQLRLARCISGCSQMQVRGNTNKQTQLVMFFPRVDILRRFYLETEWERKIICCSCNSQVALPVPLFNCTRGLCRTLQTEKDNYDRIT